MHVQCDTGFDLELIFASGVQKPLLLATVFVYAYMNV